jgi:hypothetical protein
MSDRSEPTPVARRASLAVALALVALAVAASALLAGCSAEDALREEAQATIERYAELLADGFAEMDMGVLQPVATVEQAQEEYTLMAALGEGDIIMFSEPVEIEIVGISEAADGRLIVDTREVWDYEHVTLSTSETVRAEEGVVYELRYTLVSGPEGWLVASIDSIAGEGDQPAPSVEDTTS